MEPRCYHCDTLLGDINAACPNCLPDWNRTYAPEVPQPDAPVSWEEQRYLDAQATIAALQAQLEQVREERNKYIQAVSLTTTYAADMQMDTIEMMQEVCKRFTQRTAELEAANKELEQERVRLAGCLIAAEGGTKDIVKQGDYGWSPAYQATLNLQAELERVRDQYADLMKMVLALPKVSFRCEVDEKRDPEDDMFPMYGYTGSECHGTFAAFQSKEMAQAVAALLQHRQGMEG